MNSEKVEAQQVSQPLQSRNRQTYTTGKSRTISDNSNGNSLKKLNDLIFTIKMTKEEYDDFMQIKKQLNGAR